MKWGEYSNDIQFILRRSDNSSNNQKPQLTHNSRSPIGNGYVINKKTNTISKNINVYIYTSKNTYSKCNSVNYSN